MLGNARSALVLLPLLACTSSAGPYGLRPSDITSSTLEIDDVTAKTIVDLVK